MHTLFVLFQHVNVDQALSISSELELWKELLAEPAGVPLVKTIEAAATDASSFKHFGFQETAFGKAVLKDGPNCKCDKNTQD